MLNVVNEFEENFGADNDLEYRGDLKWQGWLAKMGHLEIALTCSTKDD